MTEVTINISEVLSHISGPESENVAYLLEGLRTDGGRAFKKLADQIDAAYKPPRIPEPGMWGLVEAHTADNSTRRVFGRVPSDDDTDDQDWTDSFDKRWRRWGDLIDPTPVREGVTS